METVKDFVHTRLPLVADLAIVGEIAPGLPETHLIPAHPLLS